MSYAQDTWLVEDAGSMVETKLNLSTVQFNLKCYALYHVFYGIILRLKNNFFYYL